MFSGQQPLATKSRMAGLRPASMPRRRCAKNWSCAPHLRPAMQIASSFSAARKSRCRSVPSSADALHQIAQLWAAHQSIERTAQARDRLAPSARLLAPVKVLVRSYGPRRLRSSASDSCSVL